MQHPSPHTKVSRRQFLGLTGAALAFPTIIPEQRAGARRPAGSFRRALLWARSGAGAWGTGNTESFLKLERLPGGRRVRRGPASTCKTLVGKVNDHYKDTGCKAYHDYRELMARRDIDAVMLATPDHWHALAAVEAARQKKDIYGEKPLARTIAEQQAIVRGGAGQPPHLADRLLAALGRQLPQGGGDRAQRPDREGHARRSGPARRDKDRQDPAPEDMLPSDAAARAGLRHLDWALAR